MITKLNRLQRHPRDSDFGGRTTLSFCNFLLSTSTDDIKDFFIWLSACLIGGILFGTFSYFAHTVDCSEEEFEAKKKQH